MTLRVLVAGLGNMGRSHALAYHRHPGYEIVGLVNRSKPALPEELDGYTILPDFLPALRDLKPDVASINTYSDSHVDYAVAALEQGAHVFVEKPLALTVKDGERVVAAARANDRKLVVGYILRHHPDWQRLIAEARGLGGPYIFRMNLNQQSDGAHWRTHKMLMETTSPIVDCSVHYVDVMCQITDARPIEVRGMGLRLSGEIASDMYNYGHFQVLFEDGSLAWYEAAWGPMVSTEAFFVKDIMTPAGAISMVAASGRSDDHETHMKSGGIRVHRGKLTPEGMFATPDDLIPTGDYDHAELCRREQDYLYRAITEDRDLTKDHHNALESLRVALAADESIRTGRPVRLG